MCARTCHAVCVWEEVGGGGISACILLTHEVCVHTCASCWYLYVHVLRACIDQEMKNGLPFPLRAYCCCCCFRVLQVQ